MSLTASPFHKICRVATGRGAVVSADRSAPLRKDHFALIPAGRLHRFCDVPGHPMTLVIVCISTEYLERDSEIRALWQMAVGRLPACRPLEACTTFHLNGLLSPIREALAEVASRKPGWRGAVHAAIDKLLLGLARGHLKPSGEGRSGGIDAISGAVEHVDTRPYERCSIPEMAERCGLSTRRFTALFKEATGETFNTYLNRRRIAYAIQRLRETRHILYACHESGFNDPAYFYRVFRKFTGKTPGSLLRTAGS